MIHRGLILIALLVLAPGKAVGLEVWSFWQVSDEASAVRVDHGRWQQFLEAYVVPGDDGINLVAYDQALAEAGDRSLDRYLASLTAIDPRSLSRAEQFAYWVNLYNALTVRLVMRHPGTDSIKRMGRGLLSFGPWDDELATIAGQPVTLNDIEHRILRPIWRDHRIHFAVNCASIGCPNLSRTAYTADEVERLLRDAEISFLQHPRAVDLQQNRLRLSSLFEWYLQDFAGSERELLGFIGARRPALADALRGFAGRIEYHYDWQLNSLPRR